MADDRLFIVDTRTREYIGIGKTYGPTDWAVGGQRSDKQLTEFLNSRVYHDIPGDKSPRLVIGYEADDIFWRKWIKGAVSFDYNKTFDID